MGKGTRKQRFYKHTCQMCHKEYQSARWHSKTCSAKCRKALQRTDPTWIEPRDRNREPMLEVKN